VPSWCGQEQLGIYFYITHSLTVCSYILLFSDHTSVCEFVNINVTWLKVCVISQLMCMWDGMFVTLLQSVAPTAIRGTKEVCPIIYSAYSLPQMVHILYRAYVNLCKCLLTSTSCLFPILFEDYFKKLCQLCPIDGVSIHTFSEE
jgi:hypothetical protein